MRGAPTRWPSHCRIYNVLRNADRPLFLTEVFKLAFVADQTAGRTLGELRDLGLARIGKWQRNKAGGAPLALWAFGGGKDAKKPVKIDPKASKRKHWHARKENVIREHGLSVWRRIKTSRELCGADRIVRDGVSIFTRGVA